MSVRALVATALAGVAGIFAFSAAMGLTGSALLSAPAAAAIAGLVGAIAWRRRVIPLDEAACSRALLWVSALATMGAIVQLARLCVFIIDPVAGDLRGSVPRADSG